MDRDTGDIDDLGDTLLDEGKLLAIWTDYQVSGSTRPTLLSSEN